MLYGYSERHDGEFVLFPNIHKRAERHLIIITRSTLSQIGAKLEIRRRGTINYIDPIFDRYLILLNLEV